MSGMLTDGIRNHPDAPQSVRTGEWSFYLSTECEKQCQVQSDLDRVGHHDWNRRFQEYLKHFDGKYLFSEVAAVTWAWNTELHAAAADLVDSWRKSAGHWRDIMKPCDLYAFDMKQATSKKWYATGLFGRKR